MLSSPSGFDFLQETDIIGVECRGKMKISI
jgi:hypothetical protein